MQGSFFISILFLCLMFGEVRAATRVPGFPLRFSRLASDICQKAGKKDCWAAQQKDGSLWLAETPDFDCGTAGCVAGRYLAVDGGLVAQNETIFVQCEENGDDFLCNQHIEVFSFRPLPKKISVRGYDVPYVASYGADSFIVIDKAAACFSERGCPARNFRIRDGVFEKGLPFVDLICSGQIQDDTFECETRSHYFDKL